MFGSPNESRQKTQYSADESCYGGFESRWRYEDYCRAKSAPLRRRILFGTMLVLTLGLLGVFSGYLAFQITKANSSFYYPVSAYPADTSHYAEETGAPSHSTGEPVHLSVSIGRDSTFSAEIITADTAERYRIPRGVMVKSISPSSPAYLSGLRSGDIIVAVNDTEILDLESLNGRVASLPENGITLTVFRNNRYRDIPVLSYQP